jgi:hypothetical protein
MCEWLDACPFQDGQPFYGTAMREIEENGEAICEACEALDDKSFLESAVLAITDGNWGGYKTEQEFWRHFAAIAR